MSTQIYIRAALRRRLPQITAEQLSSLTTLVSDELARRLRYQLIPSLSTRELRELTEVCIHFADDTEQIRDWLEIYHPGHFAYHHGEMAVLLDAVTDSVNNDPSFGISTLSSAAIDELNEIDDWGPDRLATAMDYLGEQISDWTSLRSYLCSGFNGIMRDNLLSLEINLADGSLQPVVIRRFNLNFAEVSASVGMCLSFHDLVAAFRSLTPYVGLGAALDGQVLVARQALPYHGLTRGAVTHSLALVAGAVNRVKREFQSQGDHSWPPLSEEYMHGDYCTIFEELDDPGGIGRPTDCP